MRKWMGSPGRIMLEVAALVLLLGLFQLRKAGKVFSESELASVNAVHINMETEQNEEKDYIKWVEFNVTAEAMKQAYQFDVDSYEEEIHFDWIDLLAYLGAKYGGDFSRYQASDMDDLVSRIVEEGEELAKITGEMEYFPYYREAYGAVLEGMVGEYEMETQVQNMNVEVDDGQTEWKKYYGLKAFNPIAKGFPYSDYDDFGVSRSYGYKRNHLGHDMMGQVGTPVIAVESGIVTALGWNQYGLSLIHI